GDRRRFCPGKPREHNDQNLQAESYRTSIPVFRRGVLSGHVERRDRPRLLQAGLPPCNRTRAEAGGVVAGDAYAPPALLGPGPRLALRSLLNSDVFIATAARMSA